MTEKRVSVVSEADYGRYVEFARPRSDPSGPAHVVGKILAVNPAPLSNGKEGFVIRVERRDGSQDSYGPVEGTFPLDVRHRWRARAEPEWEMPAASFPPAVKRVRVLLLGEPFDGIQEDIPIESFGMLKTISKTRPDEPMVTYQYKPWGELTQIKGGLWSGRWRLATRIDYTLPYEQSETTYRFPEPPSHQR